MSKNNMTEETKKVELYFCENCEQELPAECFTMDKEGERCDSCCQDNDDRGYDAWKEQESERQMEEAEKKGV
jgi:hypothetical protein